MINKEFNKLLTMAVTSEDVSKNIDRVLDKAVERMMAEIAKYCIPIEWIKKWDADKNKDFYDCCKLLVDDFDEKDVKRIIYKDMPQYNTVQALVEDWEKENESNI